MAAHKGNNYAKGNTGKPKLFSTPQEMQEVIDAYFDRCTKEGIPFTVEGLCFDLGCTRWTLSKYEKEEGYKDFNDIVKMAKTKICANVVESGLSGKSNPTVTIFVLKNNFGYKDKQDHEITGKDGTPIINTVTIEVVRTREEAERFQSKR